MPWFAGAPREEINWGPAIDPEKCVSCGMCMNCGKKVFEWVEGKPRVVRYYDCVVGCSTCGNLCLAGAITFPDLEDVRCFYKENKVWSAVRKALIADGRIPGAAGARGDGAPDDQAC